MIPVTKSVQMELGGSEKVEALPPTSAILQQLGPDGTRRLRQILAERIDYVEDPSFEYGQPSEAHANKWTKNSPDRPQHRSSSTVKQATTSTVGHTLTKIEERQLFLQFNYARYRIAEILKCFAGRRLTARAAVKLLDWHRESLAARDALVELNMPLVLAMAKRARLGNVDFMDLVSEGNMALLRSVRKFDCSRGYAFSTYACRAILKSFSRVVKQANRYRARFPREFDPRLGQGHLDAGRRENFMTDGVDQVRRVIHENSAALNDAETTVLRARFGFGSPDAITTDAPKTLEQVGLLIGVSKERARQIQNRALAKLRLKLGSDRGEAPWRHRGRIMDGRHAGPTDEQLAGPLSGATSDERPSRCGPEPNPSLSSLDAHRGA